ncbi:MAG: hypothetical protein RL701_4370 [Pseudomonadota bacterium]|jgi:predicted nucleic acid-binding protein
MAASIFLDSEALSSLAYAASDSKAKRRARAILEIARESAKPPRVSAAVLAEVCRGKARDAAVNRVLAGIHVVAVSETIGRFAGSLLHAHGLSSQHAVDAFVVATAVAGGGGLIATSDPRDITRLAAGLAGIQVFRL